MRPHSLKKQKQVQSKRRSLGLGAMGFHAYLQRNNVPFESPMAIGANKMMFEHIKRRQKMRAISFVWSVALVMTDIMLVCVMLIFLAVAPNASSSIICGNTSPSIEPYRANAFTQKLSRI